MSNDNFFYLFETYDNYGLCRDLTYFYSNKEIYQFKAYEFIISANRLAARTGSNFNDFKKGAETEDFIIKTIKQHPKGRSLDDILINISGNY